MTDEIKKDSLGVENKELVLHPEVAEVLTKIKDGEDEYVSAVDARIASLTVLNRGATNEEADRVYHKSLEENLNRRKGGRVISINTTIMDGLTKGTLTEDQENETSFEIPQYFTFYGQAFGRISEKLGITPVEGSARNSGDDGFGGRMEVETWSGKTDNGKLLSLNVQHQSTKDGQDLRWVGSFSVKNPGGGAVPD